MKAINGTLEQRVTERTAVIQVLHDVASMANESQDAQSAIAHCLRRLATYNGWNSGTRAAGGRRSGCVAARVRLLR